MNTTSSKTERLAQAVATRRAEAAALRKRHGALSAQLADSPEAVNELLDIEAKLAAVQAGINAFEAAYQTARDEELAAEREAAVAAGLKRLAGLHKRIDARAAAYASVQAAADALIAQTAQFVAEGQALAVDAGQICIELKGTRAGDHTPAVLNAARGTSGATAQAVGSIVRRLVKAYDPSAVYDDLEINWSRTNISMVRAAECDAETLRERLVP